MPSDGTRRNLRAIRELSTAGCVTQVVNEAPLVELNPEEPLQVALKCVAPEGVEARRPIEAKHLEAAPITKVGQG